MARNVENGWSFERQEKTKKQEKKLAGVCILRHTADEGARRKNGFWAWTPYMDESFTAFAAAVVYVV